MNDSAVRWWVGVLCVASLFAVSSVNAGSAPATTEQTAPVGPVSLTSSPPNSVEAEGLIFERQQLMDQLKRDSEILGNIVAGLAPADKLAKTTRSIAQAATESVAIFNQKVPGGDAKPEVWTNHADFMKRMQAFSRNAEAMAKAGDTGNVNAVTNLMIDALPCKQCHDLYRERPKPS